MTTLEQLIALTKAHNERRKDLHVKIKKYFDRVNIVNDSKTLL